MFVPTSEVGYTIATSRRETTKVHKNMWWHWKKKTFLWYHQVCQTYSQYPSYLNASFQQQTHKCVTELRALEVFISLGRRIGIKGAYKHTYQWSLYVLSGLKFKNTYILQALHMIPAKSEIISCTKLNWLVLVMEKEISNSG